MILGTGVDIIEVDRIRSAQEKFGDRFVRRILREPEIAYCQSHRDPAPFLAARFAAKEAISKAFGTGIGSQLGWLDLEVARHPSGEPFVILHGPALELLATRHAKRVHLTLSHTSQHAVAVAILESDPSVPAAAAAT
jgi:holo-[acyl-carrier protein] synthase